MTPVGEIPIGIFPTWEKMARFLDDYFGQVKVISYPDIDYDFDYYSNEIADSEIVFKDRNGNLYAVFKERAYSVYLDIDEYHDDLLELQMEDRLSRDNELFRNTEKLVERYFPAKMNISIADSNNLWYTGALRNLK